MNLSSIYINKNILYISKQKILPTFKVGDMIKVYSKINNTNNERFQIFEGICISIHKKNINTIFKLKKISNGIYVEKSFPLYSPLIKKIKITNKKYS